jgi:MarR family transcriptional regulator, lower aerobic nicotinate degradation pathway regulator
MPIPQSILERPGALLVIAARTGQERASARLAPLGLNVRMCGVLNLLRDEGPKSQQEIGEQLSIDRTTMVEIVDELERQGIVRRERSPHDRRSYAVTLTPNGKAKQKRASEAFDAAAKEFFSPLNAAEQEKLAAMLKRLILRGAGADQSR